MVTSYGNVGPQEMEESITRPIEEALAAVQGVEEITSTSSEGQSQVRVSFSWGTDLDVAANDIRDRIDRVLGRLPEDITRPMIRKFDLSAFPIMFLSASGNLNPLDLRRIVEDQVKYRLERVPGVASVDIRGGLNREIHVNLRGDQLKALGISTDAVLGALRNENRNVPAGLYDKGNLEVLVRTQGEYRNLDEIRNTVITTRAGAPIRIADVADVEDSWEEIRQIVRIDGKPGLRISISKQSGANTVNVAEAVRAEMDRINRDIPQLQLIPIVDTSVYIKDSINNMGSAPSSAACSRSSSCFLFLRNVSSTLIISTAIPISVIATFGLMYFSGFTLNIITFGGLALGIGMLVDNAIVVLENIYRHREAGADTVQSALTGTSEVWSGDRGEHAHDRRRLLPRRVHPRHVGNHVPADGRRGELLPALLARRRAHAHPDARPPASFGSSPPRTTGTRAACTGSIRTARSAFRRIEQRYCELLQWALRRKRTVLLAALGLFVALGRRWCGSSAWS